MNDFIKHDAVQVVIKISVSTIGTYLLMKWAMNQMDPTSKSKIKAKVKAEECLQRLGLKKKSGNEVLNFTDYEMMIAAHLVVPEDIEVGWSNIAGLDDMIQELRETVILPIQKRELFTDSHLTHPPKGVLLHGPPGVGKTLIAKAIAKEAKTRFINLDISILTDKWYGESLKLTAAIFSLAVKLQPCIVFIDEIDSFLRSRNQNDHEATAMMKAQFLSLWDGLNTDPNCTVIIMGATNRPFDLDKAILRRMPATFRIGLPDLTQREHILSLIISNEPVSEDINLKTIASLTEGLSGSDLHELCRNASVYRIRDFTKKQNSQTASASPLPENSESTSKCQKAMDGHLTLFKKFKKFIFASTTFNNLRKLCRNASVYRFFMKKQNSQKLLLHPGNAFSHPITVFKDHIQREHILSLIISNDPVSEDINLKTIIRVIEWLSGSDLHELCRNASVDRVGDFIKEQNSRTASVSPLPENSESTSECQEALRPITMDDLLTSLKKFKESKNFASTIWQ